MGLLDRFRITHAGPSPIAAAAVRVVQADQISGGMASSRTSGEAWQAYRALGVVRYATNQQARLIGRLDWTVTIDGGDPLDTDRSDELLRAAFGESVDDLADRAALMLQVPGGYYLARTKANDAESWKVLSFPLSAKDKKVAEGSDVLVLVRTEDPEDSGRNDSPVLGAMDTCRELILARAQSRAQSRSRTAQHGLFLYPTEGVKDPIAFAADVTDVMVAPLSDEMSTNAVAPAILGFPSEFIEKVRTLDISGDYDTKLDAKQDRLVRQLAVELDIPPELLLGLGDSSHWNAWAIQEDNWAGHIQPMAKPIGQGFAAAIMQVTGALALKIEPDPGPLMVRRPTVADTAKAFEDGVVTDEYYREQLGADETDAPITTQEDPAVTTALMMVKAAPSLAQEPGLPALVDDIRAILNGTPAPVRSSSPTPDAPAGAEPPAPQAAAVAAALAASVPSLTVDRAPLALAAAPRRGPDPLALAAIDTQAYDSVEDLVNDTADRALERLGAKVRTMARSVAIPEGTSNARLAIAYTGSIPNADAAIVDTIESSLPRLDRVVGRAYSRLRSAGVDVHLDPDDEGNARALYASLVASVVAVRMQDKPATADAWQASRRVCAVAGGNPDPAQMGARAS